MKSFKLVKSFVLTLFEAAHSENKRQKAWGLKVVIYDYLIFLYEGDSF